MKFFYDERWHREYDHSCWYDDDVTKVARNNVSHADLIGKMRIDSRLLFNHPTTFCANQKLKVVKISIIIVACLVYSLYTNT